MILLMAAAPIIGVITFHMRGLYKLVTRYIGPEGTTRIYVAVIIAVLAWALLVLLSGIKGHPRSVVVIYFRSPRASSVSPANGPPRCC